MSFHIDDIYVTRANKSREVELPLILTLSASEPAETSPQGENVEQVSPQQGVSACLSLQ